MKLNSNDINLSGVDYDIITSELNDVLKMFHDNDINTITQDKMFDAFRQLNCIKKRLDKYAN